MPIAKGAKSRYTTQVNEESGVWEKEWNWDFRLLDSPEKSRRQAIKNAGEG